MKRTFKVLGWVGWGMGCIVLGGLLRAGFMDGVRSVVQQELQASEEAKKPKAAKSEKPSAPPVPKAEAPPQDRLTLVSPNGKYKIHLQAYDTGMAGIWLTGPADGRQVAIYVKDGDGAVVGTYGPRKTTGAGMASALTVGPDGHGYVQLVAPVGPNKKLEAIHFDGGLDHLKRRYLNEPLQEKTSPKEE